MKNTEAEKETLDLLDKTLWEAISHCRLLKSMKFATISEIGVIIKSQHSELVRCSIGVDNEQFELFKAMTTDFYELKLQKSIQEINSCATKLGVGEVPV